jgi:hypothetical protein
MSDHLFELVCGAYVFASGAYLFGWQIVRMLMALKRQVSNHLRHDIDALSDRVSRLEDKE